MLKKGRMPKEAEQADVQAWHWRILPPGPSVLLTLQVGNKLKGATTRKHAELGHGPLPENVHRSLDHSHAFWLPVDEDGDGLIDHVWMHCRSGLPRSVIAALAQVEYFKLGQTRYDVSGLRMGPFVAHGQFGFARVWKAVTPYVTPNHRPTKTGRERPLFTPEAQLRSEIHERELPAPKMMTWQSSCILGGKQIAAADFGVRRRKSDGWQEPPGDHIAQFAIITFPERVSGQLAFGYGAHFGLGRFEAVM